MSLDSHEIAQVLCRPGSRVLDVGCGPGVVAQRFVDIGCSVVGLDIEQGAVDKMAAKGLIAHVVDLDHDDLAEVLGDEQFDVIVFLDVLEHTKQPEKVLSSLLEHLAPGGDVIISLPNVTHGDVRLSLLSGAFKYREEGLLDATHLRFFDKPAVDDLVAGAGLVVRELEPVIMEIGQTELGIDIEQVAAEVLADLADDEQSRIYQWVFRAGRNGDPIETPPFLPLLDQLRETRDALDAAESYVHSVVEELAGQRRSQGEAANHITELESELSRREEHVEGLEAQFAKIQGEAEEHMAQLTERLRLSDEDLLFVQKELSATNDVVQLISDENSHVHHERSRFEEELLQARSELGAAAEELQAVKSRRLYRLLNVISRLPGAKLFAR